MRRLRLAVLLLVALAALLMFPLGSSGRSSAANTWAGTWNSDFGKMTLSASGSGNYEGFNPGSVSGTVNGNVLKGTWMQPGNPPKQGTFKFTLSADGRSFTGVWAYDSGGCGTACGWNGTCVAGACLRNGAVTKKPKKKPKGSCPALRRPSASTSLREAEPECEFTVAFDFGFKKHVLENVSGHGRVTGTSLTKLKPVELASDDDENLIRIKRNGTRIVLDVTSASYRAPKQSGNAWTMSLVTTVFRSNDPDCPKGKQVTVHIFQDRGDGKIGTSASACDEYFPRQNTENVDRRAKVNVTVKTP